MHAQGIVPKSHMFVFKVFCYQKLHTCISLLNLYTRILEVFLLPKIIYTHVFAKFVHMHIQRIFATKEITFHAYSSILLLKLHFNSTRFLGRYLFAIHMQHTYISWGILPPILHLYVHDEQHSQTTRQTSWCSPKKSAAGLKGNPYHNAFVFMLSCTQNHSLAFLGLNP